MSELWDDFVFDLDMPTDKPEDKPEDKPRPQKIRVGTQRGKQRFDMRRYASEQALLAAAPWHYQIGDTYHCISFGDVDFLTYVRHALRQQRADYLLLSSWCYGGTYVKTFYSVVYAPSCVKVATMGVTNQRCHHHVNWNACCPKIINEKWRKRKCHEDSTPTALRT